MRKIFYRRMFDAVKSLKPNVYQKTITIDYVKVDASYLYN